MTRFVLDSSVTMAWCFEDEQQEYADRLLDALHHTRALVPAIWPLEVANVLLVGRRRQRITAAESTIFINNLISLPIDIETAPLQQTWSDLLNLADELDVSSYDAAYLELALRHNLPLATLDEKLKAAARRARIDLA